MILLKVAAETQRSRQSGRQPFHMQVLRRRPASCRRAGGKVL